MNQRDDAVGQEAAPTSDDYRPVLRVVRGDPGPAELAAVVAVLTARSAPGAADSATPTSAWADRARAIRSGGTHGPWGWRASSYPG